MIVKFIYNHTSVAAIVSNRFTFALIQQISNNLQSTHNQQVTKNLIKFAPV